MDQTEYNYLIDENLAGSRLDKALVELNDLSRTRLQQLIKDGFVEVNHEQCLNPKYTMKDGDKIALSIPENKPSTIEAVAGKLDVIFEDECLLVINKPAGMTVHPGAGTKNDTLVHYLLHHCQDNLSGIGGVERPGIVHRLDRDTSGLMIVAKDDFTHHHLSEQLQTRTLKRTYQALAWGMIRQSNGTIETQLGRAQNDRTRMAVVKHGGKFARTHFKLLKLFALNNMSFVECYLDTGRTHQIRVHLSHIGHSIVGDQTYGKNTRKLGKSTTLTPEDIIQRQALHACKLEFIHPKTNEAICLEVDLAADIQKMLDLLENN